MPPLPTWYRGRAAIKAFLDTYLFTGPVQRRFRLVATRANGCPAFAIYHLDESGLYRSSALHVLMIEQDQIAQIDDFLALDNRLFSQFKLPLIA
jgi:RNA polymerase sigma-70 factor (ECF subfamily)